MAAVIALLGAAAWLALHGAAPQRAGARDAETRILLARAQESLAARARGHGALPCPDTDADGQPDPAPPGGTHACAAAVGGLPWAVLGGLSGPAAARDPWGRPLVYAPDPALVGPGALSCAGSGLDATPPAVSGDLVVERTPGMDPVAVAVVLVSAGANGAFAPPAGSAEAANAVFFETATGPLIAAPTPGQPGAALFDDRLVALPPAVLWRAMGCTGEGLVAPGGSAPGVLSVPTTLDGLTQAAGAGAPPAGAWIPRGLDGALYDSGETLLALEGEAGDGAPSPLTLIGEGGTLAVAADGTGLGVWSDDAAAPGGDLGLNADGTLRRLTVVVPEPRQRLSLSLSGFTGLAEVSAAWRVQLGAAAPPCLAPPDAQGACPVILIDGATLEAWRAEEAVGSVEVRACAGSTAAGPTEPAQIAFGGAAFDRLVLTPLPRADHTGAAVAGEGSRFRLTSLDLDACPEAGCPQAPARIELCPEDPF